MIWTCADCDNALTWDDGKTEIHNDKRDPRRIVPEKKLDCGCIVRGHDDARPGKRWWDSRGVWRAPGCAEDHLPIEGDRA